MPLHKVNLFVFDMPSGRIRVVLKMAVGGWYIFTNGTMKLCLEHIRQSVTNEYEDFELVRHTIIHQSKLSDDECLKLIKRYQAWRTSCTNGRIISRSVEWD